VVGEATGREELGEVWWWERPLVGRNLGRSGGGRGRQPGRGPLTPTSLLLAEPGFFTGSAKQFLTILNEG
jgi:hypothetical protein